MPLLCRNGLGNNILWHSRFLKRFDYTLSFFRFTFSYPFCSAFSYPFRSAFCKPFCFSLFSGVVVLCYAVNFRIHGFVVFLLFRNCQVGHFRGLV